MCLTIRDRLAFGMITLYIHMCLYFVQSEIIEISPNRGWFSFVSSFKSLLLLLFCVEFI